ncbi:putative transferase [Helianthus annuus]|nr:putative transferase [Helianthus annuus]
MIIDQLHDQRVVLVNQDSFYRSLTSEELLKVHEYNFDHPDAFDTEKLLSSMEMLKHGKSVDIPKYDFKTYKNGASRRVNPSDVIILEGILIFHDPRVRDMLNMKIFVDTGSFFYSLSLVFHAYGFKFFSSDLASVCICIFYFKVLFIFLFFIFYFLFLLL